MSLTSTLIKAGALYALGRMTTNVSADDVQKLTGISGDDLKKYGLNRADALLTQVGLTRSSNVPSATLLILSGFTAGALVGAGTTFLFYSEQGKDVRKKIAEFFTKEDGDEDSATDNANADSNGATAGNGNGEAKANA